MAPRALLAFIFPGGFLVLAAWLLAQTGILADWMPMLKRVYPNVALAAGLLLGWRFNRSRMVFGIVALALADRALLHFGQPGGPGGPLGSYVYGAVAVLLPLNLVAFSLMRERGLLTLRGLGRLGWILFQGVVLVGLWKLGKTDLLKLLTYPVLPLPPLPSRRLPDAALISFALALGALLLQRRWRSGAIESGFFWATLAALLGLLSAGPLTRVHLATGQLVLILAMIEGYHSLAFRDELTGLAGRRAMGEALLRLGQRYAVAMVDVDRFKRFNDHFGHDVGDQVLRMVAARLDKVGGGGRPFRYGGEEFSVIYRGKAVRQTLPHLERLRKTVESSGFVIRGDNRPLEKPRSRKSVKGSSKRVGVTISIGVAERNDRNPNPEDVVKAADAALYRAKRAGRNRIGF